MSALISVCMMVKNEEELLPQCLESISLICDELILVDTGSSDRTVEIAESFGAKVYHHKWTNNFSLHRNQSIGYATGDFIFILDADEKVIIDPTITKEDIVEWFEKAPEDVNSIALMVRDMQGGVMAMCCNSARIFRKGKIHYEGIVHNQPIFTGPCGICPFMVLDHYGYDLTDNKMEIKFKRTKKLLMKTLHDHPENHQVAFYLCQLYGQHGDLEDSAKWGEKYLEDKDKMGKDFNTSIYFTLIRNYQSMQDHKKAYEILRMGLREDPINPDLGLALSDQGTFTKESHIVAEGARRFLKGYKKCIDEPSTMAGKFYFSLREDAMALMIYRLCISCFQEGMDAWELFMVNKEFADSEMMEEFSLNLKSLRFDHLHQELFGDSVESIEEDSDVAKLTTKKRKSLPKDEFAIPEERKYPVNDRSHAANALARVSASGTPSEKKRVRAKVKKKYPDMPSIADDKKRKKKKVG